MTAAQPRRRACPANDNANPDLEAVRTERLIQFGVAALAELFPNHAQIKARLHGVGFSDARLAELLPEIAGIAADICHEKIVEIHCGGPGA